jgi:uncharacterized FAD-dependent dehydrogenase
VKGELNNVGKFDFIIVGAGPAGLFAALELSRAGKKVAVFDKGSPISARKCPIKTGASENCVRCHPCAIISGWGGAGAYSDGKLTLTPEFGGNLERSVGRERLLDLIEEVDRTFVHFGADSPVYEPDPVFAADVIRRGRAAGLQVIPARIRHMGTDRAKQVLASFYEELGVSCEVRTRTEIQSVLVQDGEVRGVLLADGTRVEAPAVLLAPGREGAPWMERVASDLGLSVDSLPVDIGVRVEIPDEIANDLTEQFYEVKAIFDAPTFDDRVRTFCMCPHGEVVTEYQSDSGLVIVNGHSNRDRKTQNTNFAILVSTEFTHPFRDPNGYGGAIARLANMLGGTVLVQRLGDLKAGRRSTAGRIERGLVRPTLQQAEPGDLSFALPYRHLTDILEMLKALNAIMPGIDGPHTLLYGVEVKFYSLRLSLDKGLQTSVKGLYAAGDGAGVTRGLVQASASGLVAARDFLDRERQAS